MEHNEANTKYLGKRDTLWATAPLIQPGTFYSWVHFTAGYILQLGTFYSWVHLAVLSFK